MFGVSWHQLLTHFPIVLAVVALACDVRGYRARDEGLLSLGSGILRWAALSGVAAVATGFQLAGVSGLGSSSTVTGHAGAGLAATMILCALALIRYSAENREGTAIDAFSPLWLGIEALAILMVLATAILGHRIFR